MKRKIDQLALDRWAAQQAHAATAAWVAPLKRLLLRARVHRWPLPRLKAEIDKLELADEPLVKSMVRSMKIGMGLGILDGNMRPRKKRKNKQ